MGFAEETTITANPAPQVDVDFNLEPSVLVAIQGGDLIIPHLVPGHSEQSDPITITITTNSLNGYTLSAKAGNAEDESAGANADADMTAGVYGNVVNFFATVNNPTIEEETGVDDQGL